MIPTIGRIVLYRTDGRNGRVYDLPAMIVRTRASTDKSATPAVLPDLPDDTTVDLFVFSVDGASYGESAVPEATVTSDQPRAWRWPPRV